MYPRTNYEMTEEDLNKILDACKPVPCIIVGGIVPRSQQENANAAWAELGNRMGFDHMSVLPSAKGQRFFTAVPTEPESVRADREKQERIKARTNEVEAIDKAAKSSAERRAQLLREIKDLEES